MKVCLFAVLAVGIYGVVLYSAVGRWVAGRVARSEGKADRLLFRALRRSGLLMFWGSALVVPIVLLLRPEVGRLAALVLIYAVPLLWLWGLVIGSTWLELRARGLDVGLWRFHRFNLFAGFLVYGQRIPFLSAGVAAPCDLTAGTGLLPGIALHAGIAIALGLFLRWIVMHRIVRHRELPDRELLEAIGDVSRRAGVPLKSIRLVPTERGQAVNALAATSSRVIYLAQGLWEGLERGEVRAVLLHELGHLAQRVTNLFRNLAVLGVPAALWGVRAVFSAGMGYELPLIALVGASTGLGWSVASWIYHGSEHRADLFAERWGTAGALASALRKMYALNLVTPPAGRRQASRHPALEERIRVLLDASSPR